MATKIITVHIPEGDPHYGFDWKDLPEEETIILKEHVKHGGWNVEHNELPFPEVKDDEEELKGSEIDGWIKTDL